MGQSLSTLDWNGMSNFVYSLPPNAEAIVILSKESLAEPCQLLKSNVMSVVNENAKTSSRIAFAVGKGPCPQCKVPTCFSWSKGEWKPNILSQTQLIDELKSYVRKNEINYAYLLLGDENLDISQVVGVYKLENDQFIPQPKCLVPQHMSIDRAGYLSTGGSNILLIILIIVIIILVVWFLTKQ